MGAHGGAIVNIASIGTTSILLRGELKSPEYADVEVAVHQQAPAGLEIFEPATVALLNRGVPGFAVEPDGTLPGAETESAMV